MATKAELEAELAVLRAQLAEEDPVPPSDQDKSAPDGENSTANTGPDEASTGTESQGTTSQGETSQDADHPILDRLLSGQTPHAEDIKAILEQLSQELGDLPKEKPVLTALAAFALGVLVGRMTK